jgi:predicted nucleic acid-binding protein
VTLAQADCLIAAAAVSVGVPLATGNPEDFPMLALSVQHWPVPELLRDPGWRTNPAV